MNNYSLIRTSSTADGVGLRTSVYFSGCQKALEGRACPGCHNAIAWERDSGKEWTEEVKMSVLDTLKPDYVSGLSVLGGEPLSDFNLECVLDLVKTSKELYPNKNIWMWTGYTVDEVLEDPKKKDLANQIFQYVDYLVDGPFMNDLKDPSLKFRGSSNQRILYIRHLDNEKPFFADVTVNF